jgi:hypothetical protein
MIADEGGSGADRRPTLGCSGERLAIDMDEFSGPVDVVGG